MTWAPQYFKANDAQEKKFDACFAPTISALSLQKDAFMADAYASAPLGDLISVDARSPLSNAISQAIFRLAFGEIFNAFVKVGTFEAYLTVFRKIFGEDVEVVFTVPGPGKLDIAITADDFEEDNFIARYIQDNAYVFDNIVTEAAEQIIFQSVIGFTSEYELEQMLFEMVPGGIYTQITLNLGS